MLRRFLVFTLGLMGLFCGTALLQERLPEAYRIFPSFADLLPSNPLRPFLSGYEDLKDFLQDGDSNATECVSNAEGGDAHAIRDSERSEGQRQPSSLEENPDETGPDIEKMESAEASQEGPILDSGKNFQHLEAFFKRLQALEKYRANDGAADAEEPGGAKQRIVRILHFGDSIMWGDNLSLKMKQLFQADFGDGGRGLVNIIDSPSSELLEHNNSTRRGFRVLTIPFESFTMPRTPELGFSGGSARPNSPESITSHSIPEEKLNAWESARIILGNPNRIKLKKDTTAAPPDASSSDELKKAVPYLLSVQTSGTQERMQKVQASVQGYCSLSEIPLEKARSLKLSVATMRKARRMAGKRRSKAPPRTTTNRK